jgi:hypothetical protein
MAAVVSFWQLPEEEAAFLRYLARDGQVVAIRHMEAVPDPASLRAVPIEELVGRSDSSRLFLTLRSVVSDSLPLHRWEPKSSDEPALFSLPLEFPAIVYDAGTLVGSELSRSNSVAYPSQAPEEVATWMRRVMGWLRRATPHWHDYKNYRVTERAAQAALSGASLVLYHGWRGKPTGRSSFASRQTK